MSANGPLQLYGSSWYLEAQATSDAGPSRLSSLPRRKKAIPLVSTRFSPEPSVEMSDYISVIRRRKFVIAVMTLAGLALGLFYSSAIVEKSYSSQAEVFLTPITGAIFSETAPDKAINM